MKFSILSQIRQRALLEHETHRLAGQLAVPHLSAFISVLESEVLMVCSISLVAMS